MRVIFLLPTIATFVILSGCVCQPLPSYSNLTGYSSPSGIDAGSDETETTVPEIVCNSPYILIGDDCCLDRNNNGVCDKSESSTTATTGTTLKQATSTIATMTTVSTSTVTTIIKCYSSDDCGGSVSYVKCFNGDPYTFYENYVCKDPGTPESACTTKVRKEILDHCLDNEDCIDGQCIELGALTCRQACRSEGFEGYYCYHTAECIPGHIHTPYGDQNCTSPNRYCCCYNTEVAVPSTTSTLSTIPCQAAYPSCGLGRCADPNYVCSYMPGFCGCTPIPSTSTTSSTTMSVTTSTTSTIPCGPAAYPVCGLGRCSNPNNVCTYMPGVCVCMPGPSTSTTILSPADCNNICQNNGYNNGRQVFSMSQCIIPPEVPIFYNNVICCCTSTATTTIPQCSIGTSECQSKCKSFTGMATPMSMCSGNFMCPSGYVRVYSGAYGCSNYPCTVCCCDLGGSPMAMDNYCHDTCATRGYQWGWWNSGGQCWDVVFENCCCTNTPPN